MSKKLVIVESPAKCSKIQKFLGNGYIVKASFGHIRNLDKKKGLNAVNILNNFEPVFANITEKNKYIRDLKKYKKNCSEVIIASDLDREGEAIGYHLIEVLNLDLDNTKRIVFNEITKKAITEAIENPKSINMNLVNTQLSRQILDYLIGFEISPLLWHHIKKQNNKGSWLSAGRCQSPALRIIYDRYLEIQNFQSSNYFDLLGNFKNNNLVNFVCKGDTRVINYDSVTKNLEEFKTCQFKISSINENISKSKPSAPYITSTIQQDLSNKLSISPKVTMQRLQKLYEAGKITYMRTDSKAISEECMSKIKDHILNKFSEKYYCERKYKNNTKNSQEAHECIRPVDVNVSQLDDNFEAIDKKIYSFIWKRTISSQMTELKTKVLKIEISNNLNKIIFQTSFDKTLFLGYGIIYNLEKVNDIDSIVDKIDLNEPVSYINIRANEKLTKSCGRFTEASLIKDLEKKGIGRPSTFSSIVSTLFKREYIVKDTREGDKILLKSIELKDNIVKESENESKTFKERNKIFITDLGKIVIEFLVKHFDNILNYQYTSSMENNLDSIALGNLDKISLLQEAYKSFHPIVKNLTNQKKAIDWSKKNEKPIIGVDNQSGKNIYCYKAKYGPVVQLGDEKPEYTAVPNNIDYKKITLDICLDLLQYPKIIGKYKNSDVSINVSKNGYYAKYNDKNFNIDKSQNTLDEIVKIIIAKEKSIIKEFSGNISIRNGPHGPYILRSGKYRKIVSVPYDKKSCPEKITLQECKNLLKNKYKKK